ncbi:MAG: FmdE family protein [Candidatus Hadarchaeia archaeon]
MMSNKRYPRKNIEEIIFRGEDSKILRMAGGLHGHFCPFLALGVKAGSYLIRELRAESEGMENVLAVVETNNCFSDGIQYSTGCSFGNNALVFKDVGKTAVTLAKRDEKAIRASLRPNASQVWEEDYPEYSKLFEKVVEQREGDEEDRSRMNDLSRKISFEVICMSADDFFNFEMVEPDLPEFAPIFESCRCDKCGDTVMESRIVEIGGSKLCLPCADKNYYELNGSGIRERN